MRDFATDLHRGWRRARRRPAMHAIAVATLSLGITASLAVFAVFDSVLVRRLPLPASDQLVWLGWASPDAVTGPTPAQVATWRARMHAMSEIALYSERPVTIVEPNHAELLLAATVDGRFFTVLGGRPEVGRAISAVDDLPGSSPVAVISDELWHRRYGGDPQVIGRILHTDDGDAQIVGVMPATFSLPESGVDLWIPLFTTQPYLSGSTTARLGGAIGRLRPGRTAANAARELSDITESESTSLHHWMQGRSDLLQVTGLETFLTKDVSALLTMVLTAAGALLLVACANVASLMFVQAADREREISVRRALGAGRGRVVRQLLAESFLLAVVATAVAVACVSVMLPALRGWAAPHIPRSAEIGLHGGALGAVLVLAVTSALVVGLAPALVATARRTPARGLTAGHVFIRRTVLDPRACVVSTELGVALALLMGAAVLARSVAQVVDASAGFATYHVATADLMRPLDGYPTNKEPTRRFAEELAERMSRIPEIRADAIALLEPTQAWARGTARVTGATALDSTSVSFQVVTPDYFRVLDIPLVDGRAFDSRDGPTGEPTVMLSARVAKRLFGSVHAAGQHLAARSNPPDSTLYQSYRIVGVVGDVSPPGPSRDAIPYVYIPFAREPVPHMTVLLQTVGPTASVAAQLRHVVAALDPTQAISPLRSMDDVLAESTAAPRFYLTALGAFAAMALGLATVGVYAVTLLGWRQRARELGIRTALGATGNDLVRHVMRRDVRPILAGIALGLGAGAVGTRLLRGLVSGISVTDPLSFACSVLLLVAGAALAAYVAARGVARGDPLQSIRSE
ncbi:MAG TPA: ADOP family duplicated permease [Gemmatimonadaceae bacterium]